MPRVEPLSQVYGRLNRSNLGLLGLMEERRRFDYKQQQDTADRAFQLKKFDYERGEDVLDRKQEDWERGFDIQKFNYDVGKDEAAKNLAEREFGQAGEKLKIEQAEEKRAAEFDKAKLTDQQVETTGKVYNQLSRLATGVKEAYAKSPQAGQQAASRALQMAEGMGLGKQAEQYKNATPEMWNDLSMRLRTRADVFAKPVNEAAKKEAHTRAVELKGIPQATAPKATSILLPDGTTTGGRTAGGQMQVQGEDGKWVNAPPGAAPFTRRVEAATPEGLTSIPGASKKDISDATTGLAKGAFDMATGQALLQKAQQWDASGLRGAIGSAAGTVGQVPGLEGLSRDVAKSVTGATPAELAAFRRDSRAFVAQSVAELTGEESGRITGRELGITQEALGLIDKSTSHPEVVGALQSAQAAKWIAQHKLRFIRGGDMPDLEKPEVQLEAVNELLNMGLTPEQVADTVKTLKTASGYLRKSFGDK